MNETLFSIKEAARILRVQPYQIAYLLDNNRVPEPKVRLGNRRAFSVEDIQRLADRLNVKPAKDFPRRIEWKGEGRPVRGRADLTCSNEKKKPAAAGHAAAGNRKPCICLSYQKAPVPSIV